MARSPRILGAAGIAFLVAGTLAPMAAGQTGHVASGCVRDCDPKAMNGPGYRRGEETTRLVLYGHFEDILNLAPLNTQAPDPVRERDINQGFLMPVVATNHRLGCPSACLDFHFRNNEFTMFSSPGLVEYLDEGWRTHQEPGLAADVRIEGREVLLYWYMSAHSVPNEDSGSGTGATAMVGVVPAVGVYARMETGRFKFQGDLIAESQDAAGAAQSLAERANMVTVPGRPDVYEFQVRMKVFQDIIPSADRANGFIVFVAPYQAKTDAVGGAQFMQADWRVRTGPEFPPRLVLAVEPTVRTEASSLSLSGGQLIVRWSVRSALGAYDLRDEALRLEAVGPTPWDPRGVDVLGLRRSVDCDGHFRPVNITWAYDLTRYPLADGRYELLASIPNLQDTYLAEERFVFDVVGGRPQVKGLVVFDGQAEVPGFEAFLGLSGVAFAFLLRQPNRR